MSTQYTKNSSFPTNHSHIYAQNCPDTHKVFLADGDALSLPTNHLVDILRYLQISFPRLSRVSVYANAQNVLEKSLKNCSEGFRDQIRKIPY